MNVLRPIRSAWLAAAVLVLVTSACGSTVPDDGTVGVLAGEGALGAPVGVDPLTGQPAAPGATGGASGSLGDGVSGGTGPTGGPGATGGATTSGATTPTSPGGVPEAPSRPIRIGVYYASGVNEAAEALGLGALSTGDTKAQATALAEHINASGGLAGRKIQLFFADASEYGSDPNAAYQAGCAQLVEDDDVDLMVSFAGMTVGSLECFTKAGVGVLNDFSNVRGTVMAANAEHFVATGDMSIERVASLLVDYLWDAKWLTKDSVVGVLSHDDVGSVEVVNTVLRDALAAHGLEIEEHQRLSRDANSMSQGGGAVLQFASAGVDRIIPLGANPLFVMNSASSQGYRPRWAIYSQLAPGSLLESTAPRDQLVGSAGFGYSPYFDIGKGERGAPVNANETRCLDVMKEAGQATNSGTTTAFQLTICNHFFYLQHAAAKLGSAPDDLLAFARPAVGGSFAAPGTFRTDVTKHVDGVAAVRPLAFAESCSCFQYVGGLRPVG